MANTLEVSPITVDDIAYFMDRMQFDLALRKTSCWAQYKMESPHLSTWTNCSTPPSPVNGCERPLTLEGPTLTTPDCSRDPIEFPNRPTNFTNGCLQPKDETTGKGVSTSRLLTVVHFILFVKCSRCKLFQYPFMPEDHRRPNVVCAEDRVIKCRRKR
ncbi:hypothetical protein ElyMa_003658900 [Elysia marginata]|uniref:Uncharacterized protein n=1 Tax=Elysia marginata TaxID=1093978 RepID=A0AAV4EWJ6_9GAST|nr:hypothetical protein ElyMa_003658900 [Elysia marginata]